MTSEKGNSQPLLSNTGIQAAWGQGDRKGEFIDDNQNSKCLLKKTGFKNIVLIHFFLKDLYFNSFVLGTKLLEQFKKKVFVPRDQSIPQSYY